MDQAHAEMKHMTNHFKEVIKTSGVKLTPQRLGIFHEIARTKGHPDIETIYKNVRRKMPSISLDTVYRNLDLFLELGLISTLRPCHEHVRFDANTKPHHHFVCTQCGKAQDFFDGGWDSLKVPEAAEDLGKVDSAHVELRGRCSSCLKGEDSKSSSSR